MYVYEQILQLYPDESLQKRAAKLEPMTIPRRRRPAAYPSSHGGALGGGPARDGGVVYPSAVPYAAARRRAWNL